MPVFAVAGVVLVMPTTTSLFMWLLGTHTPLVRLVRKAVFFTESSPHPQFLLKLEPKVRSPNLLMPFSRKQMRVPWYLVFIWS